MGHPRQPRRAEVGRAAAHGPGGDGEADARRARPPRHDPHGRGRQAVADPHRRGREAVGGAQGRRRPHRRDPARRGRGEGDRDRVRRDPRRRARRAAALLPVPPDAAAARAGAGEQDLRDPERVHAGARQPHLAVRRRGTTRRARRPHGWPPKKRARPPLPTLRQARRRLPTAAAEATSAQSPVARPEPQDPEPMPGA